MSDDQDRNVTFGSNFNGLPYRGRFRTVARNEPDAEPLPFGDAFVETFDLSDEKQKATYSRILQLLANGLAIVGHTDCIYDKDTKSWRVLMHWTQWYKEDAEQVKKKLLRL